jgi:hypothetical protein
MLIKIQIFKTDPEVLKKYITNFYSGGPDAEAEMVNLHN